jgi:hypothetical protein
VAAEEEDAMGKMIRDDARHELVSVIGARYLGKRPANRTL